MTEITFFWGEKLEKLIKKHNFHIQWSGIDGDGIEIGINSGSE